MKIENLHSYFEVDGGQYAFYEFDKGRPELKWRTRRLAIAFDSQSLLFYRLGIPEEVMRWAAEKRLRMYTPASTTLSVALCPSDHGTIEFNRLLADSQYITTFLQKAGLI